MEMKRLNTTVTLMRRIFTWFQRVGEIRSRIERMSSYSGSNGLVVTKTRVYTTEEQLAVLLCTLWTIVHPGHLSIGVFPLIRIPATIR